MNQRLSNIELLRIIAMLFVLFRHANFYAFGIPDSTSNDTNNLTQLSIMSFIEIFSGVGVNVFVLISGYFGIKTNIQGAAKFIFQCLFYSCSIYLLFLCLGIIDISVLGIAECFYLRKINWFPKAYLCLYILAPVLNTFVNNSSEKQLRMVVINYLIFQTIFGFISDATHFISLGYSAMSFIGLYLLARYVRLYPNKLFNLSALSDLYIYISISTLLSIASIVFINHDYLTVFWRINAYCNPLVILSSLYLLLAFTKLEIQSKVINKIAASCFAVYLLHSNPNIIHKIYTSTIKNIFEATGGALAIIYILTFILFIFILSILIDQIRIFCWNKISSIKFIKRNNNPSL